MADETAKHQPPAIRAVALLLSAAVVGFIAGLGGALLFIKPAQFSLQKQGHEIAVRADQLEKQLAALQQERTIDREELQALAEKFDKVFSKDLRSSRGELYRLQKKVAQNEKDLLVRLTKLENRAAQAEEAHKQSTQGLNQIKAKSEALEKELKKQIRWLKGKISDLEGRVTHTQN